MVRDMTVKSEGRVVYFSQVCSKELESKEDNYNFIQYMIVQTAILLQLNSLELEALLYNPSMHGNNRVINNSSSAQKVRLWGIWDPVHKLKTRHNGIPTLLSLLQTL
jgi:hypothetical protein